jgi:hypothetical protein
VIPNAISANPNAMIMAVSSRASDFVNRQILGATAAPTATQEMEELQREAERLTSGVPERRRN